MKVLWLTPSCRLLKDENQKDSYNGGGWVSSLQRLMKDRTDVQLGIAYLSFEEKYEFQMDGTYYFPIENKVLSPIEKIIKYYGGYKKIDNSTHIRNVKYVIERFHPDVIHLFGLENPLASIIGNTSVPVVVHIQGILLTCDNAFFPPGFNKWSLLFPMKINEWLIRNGSIFAKNSIHVRSINEKKLFKKMKYCMGRTNWDYNVTRLMSPNSVYYHVDEVLRECFYKNEGKWKAHNREKFIIISTISETMYKGLDYILKTANLIKQDSNISFEWRVVGINSVSNHIKFFERFVGVQSNSVSINYLGVLDELDLCMELLDSDVYVHPSYIDNGSNSVCEAQMLGMPVIATYVGGIPSLIDNGKNGYLIPSNAPYELAYLLMKLHTNRDDMSKMGRNAYEKAIIRHNKEQIFKDLMTTYQSVIKRG